jgi:hypothetical protein
MNDAAVSHELAVPAVRRIVLRRCSDVHVNIAREYQYQAREEVLFSNPKE